MNTSKNRKKNAAAATAEPKPGKKARKGSRAGLGTNNTWTDEPQAAEPTASAETAPVETPLETPAPDVAQAEPTEPHRWTLAMQDEAFAWLYKHMKQLEFSDGSAGSANNNRRLHFRLTAAFFMSPRKIATTCKKGINSAFFLCISGCKVLPDSLPFP